MPHHLPKCKISIDIWLDPCEVEWSIDNDGHTESAGKLTINRDRTVALERLAEYAVFQVERALERIGHNFIAGYLTPCESDADASID